MQTLREVVFIDAVRTPVGRYGGALKDVRPDDLAALTIKEIVQRTGIDPVLIEDVILGCANQAGEDNRNVAQAVVASEEHPAVPAPELRAEVEVVALESVRDVVVLHVTVLWI